MEVADLVSLNERERKGPVAGINALSLLTEEICKGRNSSRAQQRHFIHV